MAKRSKNKIIKKLTDKYRLIIINADSFEEKVSFRLSRLRVFVVVGMTLFFLIVGTIFLIAFTSLREYIPGYDSTDLKRKATQLVYDVDSLGQQIHKNDLYIQSIKKALIGEIPKANFSKDSLLEIAEKYDKDTMRLEPSSADLSFREEIEREDRYSIFDGTEKEVGIVFFSPVNGTVTKPYDYESKVYGVQIQSTSKAPVKAVADGTIISSDFTVYTGYTIIIEHIQGFISIYRNNKMLYKKVGEIVKSGEVIASLESSEKDENRPFLFFELWNNGYPVNPVNYIEFKE